MTVSDLPTLNAALNATAAVFMAAGWVLIKQRRITAHTACMIAALAASALFLTSYVIYHANAGSRPFPGQGPVRALYFTILITHVLLAMAIVPLVLVTVWRAATRQWERHRRIARWTLPIWLYVSVTGVVVYWMLYRMQW